MRTAPRTRRRSQAVHILRHSCPRARTVSDSPVRRPMILSGCRSSPNATNEGGTPLGLFRVGEQERRPRLDINFMAYQELAWGKDAIDRYVTQVISVGSRHTVQ